MSNRHLRKYPDQFEVLGMTCNDCPRDYENDCIATNGLQQGQMGGLEERAFAICGPLAAICPQQTKMESAIYAISTQIFKEGERQAKKPR